MPVSRYHDLELTAWLHFNSIVSVHNRAVSTALLTRIYWHLIVNAQSLIECVSVCLLFDVHRNQEELWMQTAQRLHGAMEIIRFLRSSHVDFEHSRELRVLLYGNKKSQL